MFRAGLYRLRAWTSRRRVNPVGWWGAFFIVKLAERLNAEASAIFVIGRTRCPGPPVKSCFPAAVSDNVQRLPTRRSEEAAKRRPSEGVFQRSERPV